MPAPRSAQCHTVSEVAQLLAGTLRSSFPTLRVIGEISNFMRARSGHWYFSLKDAGAQLSCVMFASDARGVAFAPADGDEVEVSGTLDFYIQGGRLQLKCRSMQRGGEGALLAAFETLKRKLAAEGLFDDALKRPLPAFPRHIGIVTSSDAAALRDILTTLSRRWPLAEVSLLPVPVQGDGAAPRIARALERLPQLAPVEVIILARGGGSIEDLWAFNEEVVARAVRACTVPVVCGVGHETDTTIADYAADLRAPTPTGAAEHATPDRAALQQRCAQLAARLPQTTLRILQNGGQRLEVQRRRLRVQSPELRLQQQAQRCDELVARLVRALRHRADPAGPAALRLDGLRRRLHRAGPQHLAQLDQRLRAAAMQLHQLSPQRTLERGYAVVHDERGSVLRDAADSRPGMALRLRLARGELEAVAGKAHD